MPSEKIDIDYVARLARIDLTEEEKVTFAEQLGNILAYVDKLNQVDVSGVEPMAHAFALENVLDDDEPGPALTVKDALRNAPAQRDNQIVVPKVVEDA
ncbi:MAG: Asp-tRNA(Asn)/Glu-tRNA(Gln) amidotransferase subunit GatC [Verrucomicrobiota bacterium JB024]|jgi:aspartyl-tRNA(Asn)/glutamyl-tRNA(Gln) amidotransferase subunit C|nr:Asp-tRNA(Asn)/Glu-tRNA(Gln) amidotransferase subunit GatC [Verrucomicrobiota bacterium JB024]